jgi:hypothetical protein
MNISELSVEDLSREDIRSMRKLCDQAHQRSIAKSEIKFHAQELLKYLDITSFDMNNEDVTTFRELLYRFA